MALAFTLSLGCGQRPNTGGEDQRLVPPVMGGTVGLALRRQVIAWGDCSELP